MSDAPQNNAPLTRTPQELTELVKKYFSEISGELAGAYVGVGLLILYTPDGKIAYQAGLPSAQLKFAIDAVLGTPRG